MGIETEGRSFVLRASKQSRRKQFGRQRLRRLMGVETLEARYVLDSTLINTALSSNQRTALLNGLDGISAWASTLDTYGKIGQQIPLIDQSLGSALRIGDLIQSQFVQPIKAAAWTSTSDLVVALSSLASNQTNIGLNVSNVVGGLLTNANSSELQFQLKLNATRTASTDLDLGVNAVPFGIELDGGAQAKLDTSLQFNFTFGIDLSPGLSPTDAFFIRVTSLTAGAKIEATGFNAKAKVGFLDVQVVGGSISLNAQGSMALLNPNNDALGNITLSELQGTPLSSLVNLTTPAASLTSSLPLTNSLFNAGVPTISLSSIDVFQGQAPSIGFNTQFNELLNFNRLTPSSFLGLFNSLGTSLQEIRSGLDASTSLPFISDKLSDVVDFAEMASNFVRKFYDVGLVGSPVLPANGQLTSDALLSLSVDGAAAIAVTVPKASTTANTTADDLVADINAALPTGLKSLVVAKRKGNQLQLVAINSSTRTITATVPTTTDPATKQLGITNKQASGPIYGFDSIQSLIPVLADAMGISSSLVLPKYDPASGYLHFPSQHFGCELQ